MSSRKKFGDMEGMQIGSSDTDFLTPRQRAPKIVRYPPPKTTIAAFLFFFGGLFFLAFGLSVLLAHIWKHGQDRGIAMIVLGGLMFIPGSYAVTIIVGTWYGWRGYDYSQLPSYDE